MLPALITTLLFSLSAVAGSRLSRLVGGFEANFWRISLATMLLGLWAHTAGQGFAGQSLHYFLVSGLIGFGIGDLALYQAFPRIGSRLCMVLVHCLAAPMAAAIEWKWLGTVLSPFQMACSAMTLAGVALALAPSEHLHIPRRRLAAGVACGVVAAVGQAVSSVISRKAFAVAAATGLAIDGTTAAYQRIWGGLVVALGAYLIYLARSGGTLPPFGQRFRPARKWLLMNGFAGPALGVSCYQWALSIAPTGIVMPIVALTPLVIIPFSQRLEGERPTRRSLLGGAIAVLGVVGLRFSLK
jgi:drug/metabolite transporter (DMT)-like permease